MTERPVVGITAGEHDARWGVSWQARAMLVTSAYLDAVAGAGGIPVALPPAPGGALRVASRLDALILTGGADVDPARYGHDPHAATRTAEPARDDFELELVAAAEGRGLPLLAVCRGVQVLNVGRGGTLHQHLPDVVGSADHAPVPGSYGQHRVRLDPAGLVSRVLGGRVEAVVPTHHHQAVDRVGRGLVPSAWADDGTVEALEDPSAPFLLGIQWHPEQGADPALFHGLVDAAVARMEGPATG